MTLHVVMYDLCHIRIVNAGQPKDKADPKKETGASSHTMAFPGDMQAS